MEDSEKVIVNFVNENNGKRHELEIPLNITAKALVTALNKAYNLQIDKPMRMNVIWPVSSQLHF